MTEGRKEGGENRLKKSEILLCGLSEFATLGTQNKRGVGQVFFAKMSLYFVLRLPLIF